MTASPVHRIAHALEMITVFEATHRRPGLAGCTRPEPTTEEVAELLVSVRVELIAGMEPTPGDHGPGCWEKPGHHLCAIEKVRAMEGATT